MIIAILIILSNLMILSLMFSIHLATELKKQKKQFKEFENKCLRHLSEHACILGNMSYNKETGTLKFNKNEKTE